MGCPRLASLATLRAVRSISPDFSTFRAHAAAGVKSLPVPLGKRTHWKC